MHVLWPQYFMTEMKILPPDWMPRLIMTQLFLLHFVSILCNRKSETMHADDSYRLARREFSEEPHTLEINVHTNI